MEIPSKISDFEVAEEISEPQIIKNPNRQKNSEISMEPEWQRRGIERKDIMPYPMNPLDFAKPQKKPKYEEVIEDINNNMNEEPILQSASTSSSIVLEEIPAGQYGLVIRGILVGVAENKNDLEALIEKIVLDDEDNRFPGVNMEEVYLFKRLAIKVGVVAIDG